MADTTSITDVVQASVDSMKMSRRIYEQSDSTDMTDIKSPRRPAIRQDVPRQALAQRLAREYTHLSPHARRLFRRLQTAQASFLRNANAREKERASIASGIKKTAFLVVGLALFMAAICDILSIAALGWILSWSIPMIGLLMVGRINAMLKTSHRIVEATTRLEREESIVRQRLAQVLSPAERTLLGVQTRAGNIKAGAKSYVSTFIRDSAITQLLELIPIVDILPLYLGQVMKMVVNQNIEYQKVQKLMPLYTAGLEAVNRLERLEINALGRRLQAMVRQQSEELARIQELLSEPAPAMPVESPSSQDPAPGTMRDVAPALVPAAA